MHDSQTFGIFVYRRVDIWSSWDGRRKRVQPSSVIHRSARISRLSNRNVHDHFFNRCFYTNLHFKRHAQYLLRNLGQLFLHPRNNRRHVLARQTHAQNPASIPLGISTVLHFISICHKCALFRLSPAEGQIRLVPLS